MDSNNYSSEWLCAFREAAQLVSRDEVLYDSVGLPSLQTGEGRPVCDFGIIDEIIDRCAKLYADLYAASTRSSSCSAASAHSVNIRAR